jgi:hypothetical protein
MMLMDAEVLREYTDGVARVLWTCRRKNQHRSKGKRELEEVVLLV